MPAKDETADKADDAKVTSDDAKVTTAKEPALTGPAEYDRQASEPGFAGEPVDAGGNPTH